MRERERKKERNIGNKCRREGEGKKTSEKNIFWFLIQEGNEAGEYLFYTAEGNIMIFTDSDTVPGMGFLLLTPNWKNFYGHKISLKQLFILRQI